MIRSLGAAVCLSGSFLSLSLLLTCSSRLGLIDEAWLRRWDYIAWWYREFFTRNFNLKLIKKAASLLK